MNTELLSGYTRDDIRREVLVWTGRELSIPRFYGWLPYCFEKPKLIYTKRTVAKFVFVGQVLNVVRSLEVARQRLKEDIDQNPWRYEL